MLQSKNRTKSSKSIHGTIARALLAALALALMFACSSSSDTASDAPDYVGTWSKLDGFGTGTGTLTVIFTASTVTYSVSGGTLNGGTASGSLLVDEAAKHMTQSNFTTSGALTAQFTGITSVKSTYEISGTTMQLAQDTTGAAFPATATSGSNAVVLTKQ